MPYFLAPFIGWLVSGCLKFLINVVRYGKDARNHMGNGGFPSTHTSTLATVTFLIGFGEGWFTPVFGLATGILFIVMIDALGLRNYVGKQATVINDFKREDTNHSPLRERMGHTRIELAGGLVVGFITSFVLYQLYLLLGWI